MSLTAPDFISADEALTRIQGLTGSNATIQGVVDIINRINPFAPNATSTIGYAGGIDGKPMYEIVQSYARSHPEAAIIDNTAIYDLLNRQSFKNELQRIINEVNATNPDPATRLTFSEVYEGKNISGPGGIRVNNTSMWDVGSSHFMENAIGDVKIFAPFADKNSVLIKTEIPKLLNTPGVTSINGIPIDIIKTAWNAGNTELAINTIKASSLGQISVLTPSEIGGVINGAQMLANDSRLYGLMHEIIQSKVGTILSNPVVQKLGTGIAVISFGIAAYDAADKYNSGDTAGAIHIMEEWTAQFAGVVGGGTVAMTAAGSLVAAVFTGASILTGVIITPGVIAAGFVLAAGVLGGYYGSQLGSYLLEKGRELELYTQQEIDAFVKDIQLWWAEVEKSGGLSEYISAAYWKFLDSIAKSLIDPLIIDLNNNGIALDSWQASAALFDLNGNGSKENTGWTKANGDDAFLVIDKNSNGKIDDITEMFGNASIPGFTELAKYDSNKDNLINSLDSQFSLLRLWNDKNANGTVDTGEMTTLAQNNITEISLNKYNRNTLIAGNVENAISTITMNGVSKNIHELAFATTPALDTGSRAVCLAANDNYIDPVVKIVKIA